MESTNSKKYGSIPGKKPSNIVYLIFENWNSISLWQKGRKTINNINALIRRFETDAIFGYGTQCDWSFAEGDNIFYELFGQGQERKGIAAWNKNEKRAREQYCGTAVMDFGHFAGHVVDTGTDETGLGIWSWILVGLGKSKPRIVVVYNPYEPGKDSKGSSVLEQQERYFEAQGNFTSPCTLFHQHF